MALLGDDFTGRIGHCELCDCPAVFVGGKPMATDPGDKVIRSTTHVRGVDMPTITFHRGLCPRAHVARSN